MLSPDSAPPELQSGRYEVGSLLHESPGASLYLGREKDTGLTVVLKCFEPGQRRAYLREASAALGLNHPNIVRCLDTFRLPTGGACVVYEYLAGGTLAQALEENGPLALAEIWRCLGELAEGLAFLHGTGRIHCDLKPDNVFLRASDSADSSRYVLGDLGSTSFLKEAKEGRRSTSTPAYVAPERVYDRHCCNSDLYSLGVLGFEIATGQRPFAGATEAVIRAHLTQPPPLHRLADGALRRVLESLLEKEPSHRIQSAETLLALIHQARSGGGRDHAADPEREKYHPTPRQPEAGVQSLLWSDSSHPKQALDSRTMLDSTAALPSLPLSQLGECQPHGVFRLNPSPEDALPLLATVLETDGRVYVALDHGSHAVVRELGGDTPDHVIAKIGGIRAPEPGVLSYATSSRVFRFDPRRARASCVWEGCQGLLSHSLAQGFLLWQSRRGLEYVNLAQGRTHSFRADSYLSPVQTLIRRDGGFCHSDGIANEQLVFRSPEAKIQAHFTLDGPILGLAGKSGPVLAVLADLARGGRSLAISSPDSSRPRILRLPAHLVDWCCTPDGVFWISQDGGLYGADAQLDQPIRLGHGLPDAAAIRVSGGHRWLALLCHTAAGAQLALWKIPTLNEGRSP